MAWTFELEDTPAAADEVERHLVLEVDPRENILRIVSRAVGSSTLDTQSGAVARSPFPATTSPPGVTRAWLASDEAGELLARIERGYACEVLWTGDPVATWSDDAWEAGHTLYLHLSVLLGVEVS